MRGKGRHDPCVLPRAVPMVEAMMSLVLVDHLMMQQAQCELFPNESDSKPNPMGTTAKFEGERNFAEIDVSKQQIDEE